MGNYVSGNLDIELYKWSSPDFPQEYALIYTSTLNESKFTIFRFSVKPEKVLLRLADYMCNNQDPVRLDMEIIAERDNNNNKGLFKCRLVRVIQAGTFPERVPFRDEVVFSYLSYTGACLCTYHVKRHGGNMNNMIWEVWYSCVVGLSIRLRFCVKIECDKETGLSVKFKGPFKFYGHVLATDSWLGLESSGSLIQREVNGEPPKQVNSLLKRKFSGKKHVLFQQGKLYSTDTQDSDNQQEVNVFLNNSGGHFLGNGHGSRYENCNILMQYLSDKDTN